MKGTFASQTVYIRGDSSINNNTYINQSLTCPMLSAGDSVSINVTVASLGLVRLLIYLVPDTTPLEQINIGLNNSFTIPSNKRYYPFNTGADCLVS